jgi:hypothetical protein
VAEAALAGVAGGPVAVAVTATARRWAARATAAPITPTALPQTLVHFGLVPSQWLVHAGFLPPPTQYDVQALLSPPRQYVRQSLLGVPWQ